MPSARAGSPTVRPAARPRSPARCAAATSSAPGSATPGQPASESEADVVPAPRRREQLRAARWRRLVADLDERRSACSGIAVASDLQELPRRLRVLDDEVRERRARRSIVRAGSTALRRDERRAGWARGRGVRAADGHARGGHGHQSTVTPAARSMSTSRISGKPISAVGSSLAMRVEQRDAERLDLDASRRSRTVARARR